MNLTFKTFTIYIVNVILLLLFTTQSLAQEKQAKKLTRNFILTTAKEIMDTARYCALITIDSSGQPQARAMDPFPPEENMVIWLGTTMKSRKVQEIRNNPKVTLYFADPGGGGYVSISGDAQLIDDQEEKTRLWKEEWEPYYSSKDDYILIKVIPKALDILSYKRGIIGDSITWRTSHIDF
jgi:general stress protein 26